MALPGIRLADLYNSEDYKNWMGNSTNVKLVESTIRNNRFSDPDKIRGHLYMNSKIKQDLGEDVFNSLPEGSTLDDKINFYNSNLPEVEPQVDTTTVQNQSGYYHPETLDEGDIVPVSDNKHAMWDWFKERFDGAADIMYQRYLDANKKQERRTIIDPLAQNNEITRAYQRLEKLRNDQPENTAAIKLLENSLNAAIEKQEEDEEVAEQKAADNLSDFRFVFDNVNDSRYLPVNRELWDSAKTSNTIDDLSSELRDKMEANPQFAFSAFEQFDRLAAEMIPQYRNYHDTEAMPITPNEMKDLMAQYYAIRTIKDLNEANNFVQKQLQHVIASHQSILKKADVALQQAGTYFVGNTAATLGIVANTPNAIAWALRNDMDIEDLRGFKEFLFYTTQNPLTQWANDLQTTGTWLRGAQEAFKEQEYNRLQLQREAGRETKFLDINTPFEIAAQGAYTVAGMWTGTTAAQILNATVSQGAAQLATKILSREAAGWGTRFAARAINTLGNAVAVGATAYLPAAAEASMDAMETYNLVKESAEQDVLTGIEKELQADLEDGTFEEWYNRNSRLPLMMPPAEGWAPGELERQIELRNQERAYLWDQYRNMKAQQVLDDPETKQAIENLAFRTGAKTMFDEATWIAFGDMFFSNILGKSFKELKKGVVRGVTGKAHTPYNWVPEGNYYKAVPKPITWWDKTKAVSKGLVEAGEEGFEELFQTVDSQMREDIAHNYIAEYIANRYDPDAIGQLTDNLRENWDVAKRSIGENVFSEEALYSFALGAVSAGLGSPTIARGIKSTIDKKAKGQPWSIRDFWRNPIAENLQELKIKEIQDADEAADINRWLQQHPEISTYNDETAILKFLAQQEDAAARDDEVTYRDALMGQKVATMLMMNRVRPNGMKLNLNARLRAISRLDASSPEARAIVDQMLQGDDSVPRTTEGSLNEEEIEVLNKAKKRAQEDINTYKNVKAQMAILDSQFGNSISTEAKEALAYGLIMRGNWGKRIDDIIKNATDSYNQANPENQVAPISQEETAVKNAIARYGNLKAVEDEYKALMAQRNAIRANKRNMYKQEYKTELDKTAQQIKENRAAKRELSKQELPVISANEILSLSNKARAYLLDNANRENYSEAQKAEIDKFVTSEGVNDQIITDLKDAGRLENKANYFVNQYNELSKNNGALVPLFDREIRAKASEKWSKAKLGNVLEATTYEQFRDELDKALATGEFTSSDRMQFSRIFNDKSNPNPDSSKFYQQYQKEEMSRAQTRRIIENSPAYKELSDAQKEVAAEVISDQQLTREPLTAKNIIEKLNDPKFAEKLTKEELEQLAQAIDTIMKQKEAYDRTVAAEKERQEKLAKAKMVEDAARRTPAGNPQTNTVINNTKYQNSRDFFDTIFKKVASIFTKTNPQTLSKEEFINLIGLYSEEPLSADILGEDFDTSLTLSNIGKIIQSLLTAVENAAYLNPNAAQDVKYQNTMQLIGTLKGIAQIIQRGDIDLNTFIRNSILEVNPSLSANFKTKTITKLPSRLKRFGSKTFKVLGSQAEKDWYNNNDIEGNLAKISALRAHKQDYVFIRDNSLINDVRNELGLDEFTDDTLPLIIAARVTEGVEGAVKLEDGNYYLYVGLLQDSRDSALYDKNELNALRSAAIEQEESGPIKQNGKVYVSRGAIIKYTNKSEDTVTQTDSIKDWLLDKHKGDKEAAKKDFIEHFRGMDASINKETGLATGSVEWKGKRIKVSFPTGIKNRDTYKYAIYLLEKPDGSVDPKILFVRDLDEFTFDDELGVADVFEALSGPLLTDKRYQKAKELDFLRRPINYIYTRGIGPNVQGLKSSRGSTRDAAINSINKTLSSYLSKKFNFKKTARGAPEFQIEVVLKDGNLQYTAYQETDAGKTQYRDIPRVLAEIPIEDIDSQEAVLRFAQNALKTLMYDDEGNLRRDDEGYPLVKFQINYRENEQEAEKVFDSDRVEDLLLANAWKLVDVDMNPTPESIEVNPTVQNPVSIERTGNKVKDAIAAITQPEFIDEHEGEHFEVGPNETEVTTFIHGVDDGTDFESLTNKMATNLGTSVDKLYRVWRKTKSTDGVIEYMKSRGIGSWVGISRTYIPEMCGQFERIEKFFESRGEQPIPVDLIFRGPITVNGKTHYFIGKPDIITVDKQGKYHIYDMKSFRYQSGATKSVPGFRNSSFILNGLRNFDTKYEYWQKQMSIYRMLIESKLGEGTVVPEFGVIPVRLGYNPQGTIDDYVVPGIGANKMTGADGKALHLDFSLAPMEQSPTKAPERITRCYDDAIRIPAILDITTINPTGWKQMSKADELKSSLEEVRKEVVKVSNEPVPQVETTPAPKEQKSLKSMTQDEIAEELAGPEVDVTIEELIAGACD